MKMCQVFGVSRSGYYAWLKRPQSERIKKAEELSQTFIGSFSAPQLYGSPKITQILRSQGHVVSQKTVARLMKEKSLRSRTFSPFFHAF